MRIHTVLLLASHSDQCCLGVEVLTDGERILEIVSSGSDAVVTENGAVKVMVNGREVVLFLWSHQLFCVGARCPHMGKRLYRYLVCEQIAICACDGKNVLLNAVGSQNIACTQNRQIWK